MTEKFSKIRLHPENPIEVPQENPFKYDYLGFKESVLNLYHIMQNIRTPFTLGIFGSWGSGKTSFMKLLEAQLKKEDLFVPFWFNAWQYENENSLLIPLLSSMKSVFKEHENLINKVKKSSTVLLLSGANILLKSLTLGNLSSKDVIENFKTYEDNFEKFYDSWVSEIDTLKKEFEELIIEIKKDKRAVIVFIDDLDRCMPENVIRLIENIKHFLSVEGCIFVIGVDKNVLSKGIQARYGSNLISGDEYLEKIINLSFYVPHKLRVAKKEFIFETFRKYTEAEWFEEKSGVIERFVNIIEGIGFDNPRRLRSLILRCIFFLSFPEYDKYIPEFVIRLIGYREFFPNAYNQKKHHNDVVYFPRGAHLIDADIEELKRQYGEDFAKIIKDHRFTALRGPNIASPFHWILSEGVKTLSDEELIAKAKKTNFAPIEIRNETIKLLEGKCIRDHEKYFDLVDFLFSLS